MFQGGRVGIITGADIRTAVNDLSTIPDKMC